MGWGEFFTEAIKNKPMKSLLISIGVLVVLFISITLFKIAKGDHVRFFGSEFNIPQPTTESQPIKKEHKLPPITTKNMNFGTNNGVVGDVNGNVSFAPKQRILNDKSKRQLLNDINDTLLVHHQNKNIEIGLMTIDNPESMNYGNEIIKFLKRSGYNVDSIAGWDGNRDFGIIIRDYNNGIGIIVGYPKESLK